MATYVKSIEKRRVVTGTSFVNLLFFNDTTTNKIYPYLNTHSLLGALPLWSQTSPDGWRIDRLATCGGGLSAGLIDPPGGLSNAIATVSADRKSKRLNSSH